MILRHSLFKADVAQYRFLMLVVSAHNNYLNHPPVETIVPNQVPCLFSASCLVVPFQSRYLSFFV